MSRKLLRILQHTPVFLHHRVQVFRIRSVSSSHYHQEQTFQHLPSPSALLCSFFESIQYLQCILNHIIQQIPRRLSTHASRHLCFLYDELNLKPETDKEVRIQYMYIRLGVRRQTSNKIMAVRLECGRKPILMYARKLMYNYYLRLRYKTCTSGFGLTSASQNVEVRSDSQFICGDLNMPRSSDNIKEYFTTF